MRTVSQDTIVHVYGLADPRDGQLRYVGVSRNPNKRFRYHCQEGRSGKQTMKARWISGLLKLGMHPQLFIIEETIGDAWKDAEQFWIAYFRSIGVKLLNLTIGGDGTMHFSHSDETRHKISQANVGRKLTPQQIENMRGRPVSPEHRLKLSIALKGRGPDAVAAKKISEALKGRVRPEDVRRKISESHKGKKLSPEHVAKVAEKKRSKPFCKRGHPRAPGEKCRVCENLRASMYRSGKRVFEKFMED